LFLQSGDFILGGAEVSDACLDRGSDFGGGGGILLGLGFIVGGEGVLFF
jgi:hypothetical protein